MNTNHDIVTIDAKILRETQKAVMVENLIGKDVWLAKILIDIDITDDTIQMEEWLAVEKRLV